jgi:DNA-binding XRE family transcriptional regulator
MVARTRRPVAERFWEKVVKTSSCWLWTAGTFSSGGYGAFQLGRGEGTVRAHRFAWELLRGPIPEGMEVCHNCPGGDNPLCVNPDHMFLGTQTENIKDMWAKGRANLTDRSLGEDHGLAKLNPEKVREIRILLGSGRSRRSIAQQFEVDPKTISNIERGRIWTHVA